MSLDFNPQDPAGHAFQTAVRRELSRRGWSTDDDPVMSEYCLVMLGNNKSRDQIASELHDLVGGDFRPDFVDWMFAQIPRFYSSSEPVAEPSAQDDNRRQQPRSREPRRSEGSESRTGVHRGRYMDGNTRGEGHERRRTLGSRLDTKPYSRPEKLNDRIGDRRSSRKAAADVDHIRFAIEAVVRGDSHPSVLATIPFAALVSHPSSRLIHPSILAQAQAHAMAQIQAFSRMQGPMQKGFAFGPGFRAPKKTQVPPTKPKSEQICNRGTECRNVCCWFSHPSPVATKESGIVLDSEPCAEQIGCVDADCKLSHVSPAQKNLTTVKQNTDEAEGAATELPSQKPCRFAQNCTREGCYYVHPWDAHAATKPCHWAENCTRYDCKFLHPASRPQPKLWDRSKYSVTLKNGAVPHVSERMAGFGDLPEDGVERIIPGSQPPVTEAEMTV